MRSVRLLLLASLIAALAHLPACASDARREVASAAAGAAADAVVVTNRSGTPVLQYPLQFARPFLPGKIRRYPQIVFDGTPIPTQADVKQRYPDGSVKHAVLSAVLPRIPASGPVTLTFRNQDAEDDVPPSRAELLGPKYDFDAVVHLEKDGTARSASARRMLDDGKYAFWTKGPIATTLILGDSSPDHTYDLGFDEHRPFRPMFHATFWPTLGKVRVRFIGQVSDTETLEDMSYGLELTVGRSHPRAIYRDDVRQPLGTRWTRRAWINGDPERKIDVDYGIAYLAKTRFVPNYDPSLRVSERAVRAAYAAWENAPKGIGDQGNWTKYMDAPGGRPEIGPYVSWVVQWLYTGDWRLREKALGNAELAGAWPMHFLEGAVGKSFDRDGRVPALGRIISLSARPTLFLHAGNRYIAWDETRPEDRLAIVGPYDPRAMGWRPSASHQPETFAPIYAVTGDPFYLEEAYFWASWDAFSSNPSPKVSYGRGPSGDVGGLFGDDIRLEAWALRTRAETAFVAPDGAPEKAYFGRLATDALAIWEGARDVAHGAFEGTPLWRWGRSTAAQRYPGAVPPPLHFWTTYSKDMLDDPTIERAAVGGLVSPWAEHFVIYALGRARELGFPTDALLVWAGERLVGPLSDPGFDPWLIGSFQMATEDPSGAWLTTWRAVADAYAPAARGIQGWPKLAYPRSVEHGYNLIAQAAASFLTDRPGGPRAWSWLSEANRPYRSLLDDNPKWAVVPRPAERHQALR